MGKVPEKSSFLAAFSFASNFPGELLAIVVRWLALRIGEAVNSWRELLDSDAGITTRFNSFGEDEGDMGIFFAVWW